MLCCHKKFQLIYLIFFSMFGFIHNYFFSHNLAKIKNIPSDSKSFKLIRFTPFSTDSVDFKSNFNLANLKLDLKSTESVENGVNLINLNDFESDGTFLSKSIKTYFDEEYIALPIHEKIGEQIKTVYIAERLNGVTDLGEMLMKFGTSLESMNLSEAFVGPWDIANKVSDLLMVRMGRELCSCAGDMNAFQTTESEPPNTNNTVFLIKDQTQSNKKEETEEESETEVSNPVEINQNDISEASQEFRTVFKRYKLLRDFCDGDVSWDALAPVIALSLGFRVENNLIFQKQHLCPLGWEDLKYIPNFSNYNDVNLIPKLIRNFPDEEESLDLIIETLVGMEFYKLNKNSLDADLQQRYLVSKWLYVHGFLSEEFPQTKRFIPGHLLDSYEDEEEEGSVHQ